MKNLISCMKPKSSRATSKGQVDSVRVVKRNARGSKQSEVYKIEDYQKVFEMLEDLVLEDEVCIGKPIGFKYMSQSYTNYHLHGEPVMLNQEQPDFMMGLPVSENSIVLGLPSFKTKFIELSHNKPSIKLRKPISIQFVSPNGQHHQLSIHFEMDII